MQVNVIIWMIAFLILTLIIVITKDSGRISEVAARFSLHAIPVK